MKIAITADLHLTSRYQHPERFQTLENIFISLVQNKVDILIIAGDLFDSSLKNPAEFEALCQQERFHDLNLFLIPGNHDPTISDADFTLPNLKVISEPEIISLDEDAYSFLFIPYQEHKTMGEILANCHDRLTPDRWNLVGHGDWSSLLQPNPYEPGVYMPLTRTDIDAYRPATVFLGHIHSPLDLPPVYYPGSPCGLNITETGKRRILLYDTEDRQVEAIIVDSPVLYFNETLLIVPVVDESKFLREEVRKRITSWDLGPGDKDKVLLSVNVKGFSADRGRLMALLKEEFKDYAFHDSGDPDLTSVSISEDGELNTMAASVKDRIMALTWPSNSEEPSKDEIIFDALKVIYGE
jgi:DNA repair exonuclease SbcCD nuclease subunit